MAGSPADLKSFSTSCSFAETIGVGLLLSLGVRLSLWNLLPIVLVACVHGDDEVVVVAASTGAVVAAVAAAVPDVVAAAVPDVVATAPDVAAGAAAAVVTYVAVHKR